MRILVVEDEQAIAALTEHLRTRRNGQDTLERLLRRPEVGWEGLTEIDPPVISSIEWTLIPPSA